MGDLIGQIIGSVAGVLLDRAFSQDRPRSRKHFAHQVLVSVVVLSLLISIFTFLLGLLWFGFSSDGSLSGRDALSILHLLSLPVFNAIIFFWARKPIHHDRVSIFALGILLMANVPVWLIFLLGENRAQRDLVMTVELPLYGVAVVLLVALTRLQRRLSEESAFQASTTASIAPQRNGRSAPRAGARPGIQMNPRRYVEEPDFLEDTRPR